MSDPALDEFLVWFRRSTEEAWANYETATLEAYQAKGVGGSSWRSGTLWKNGLAPAQIDAVEEKFGIHFPPDFRAFLTVLNVPDRGQINFRFANEEPYQLKQVEDRSAFYDWNSDDMVLRQALIAPFEGLIYSVENDGIWLDSWGKRPSTSVDRAQKLGDLINAAPPLIPLFGHRYLVGLPLDSGNPVLSVYGSDIIVYGKNLRSYLLVEFYDLLGESSHLMPRPPSPEIPPTKNPHIPFWSDLL